MNTFPNFVCFRLPSQQTFLLFFFLGRDFNFIEFSKFSYKFIQNSIRFFPVDRDAETVLVFASVVYEDINHDLIYATIFFLHLSHTLQNYLQGCARWKWKRNETNGDKEAAKHSHIVCIEDSGISSVYFLHHLGLFLFLFSIKSRNEFMVASE